MRPTPAALAAAPAQTLLTLQVGSVVLRLTDGEAVTVTRASANDTAIRFESGLLPISGVTRALSWFSSSAPTQTASVQFHTTTDIAQEIARGHRLDGSEAEIAQWRPGQTWEERRVLLAGIVSDSIVGPVGEQTGIAIESVPDDDQATLISATHVVNDQTLPRLDADRPAAYVGANERIDPQVLGAAYPIILGSPGTGPILAIAGIRTDYQADASAALYVERTDANNIPADHVFLVAGHALDATTVQYHNVTDGITETVSVATAVDNLGQQFAYVSPGSSPNIPAGNSAEVYVSFDSSVGGGLPDPYGTGPLQRADHIIRWALDATTIKVDRRALGSLAALRSYVMAGPINDPTQKPWPWVAQNILPLLPVSVTNGPRGVGIVVWNPRATTKDAVAHIEVGRNAERLSGISRSPDRDVVNDFTIRFGLDARTGLYCQQRRLVGTRTKAEKSDQYVMESAVCRKSRAAGFAVRRQVIETPWVWSGPTGEQILGWRAAAFALPRASFGVRLAPDLDWLNPGDVVTVTDSDEHIDTQVAHVTGLQDESGGVSAALTWWEPARYAQ